MNNTVKEATELLTCTDEQELETVLKFFFARDIDNCKDYDFLLEEESKESYPSFFEYATLISDSDDTLEQLFPCSLQKVDSLLDELANKLGEQSEEYRAVTDLYMASLNLGMKAGTIFSMLTDNK